MSDKIKAVQLRIDIKGAKPPIWRRVSVPAHFNFAHLHEVIQILFGWQGYHMHEFDVPDFGLVMREDVDEDDRRMLQGKTIEPTCVVSLSSLLEGMCFSYIYDFGDWWEHTIKVEKIIEQEEDYPRLLKWSQDNLCEDAGGLYGYYDKLQYLEKNNHPDVEDIRSWFDMQHLDFDEHIVKMELMEVGIEDEDMEEEPFIAAMKDMLEVFDYVDEDALFHVVTFDKKDYYIWLHEGERARNIRVYASAYDCAISCMYEQENEHVHPLFTNGVIFEYPDVDEEYDEYDDNIDALTNGKYTFESYGNAKLDLEEADELLDDVSNIVCSAIDGMADVFTLLPNINDEQRMIRVEMLDEIKMEISFEEFKMAMMKDKIQVTPSMLEAISSKKNTDVVSACILPIPNLLHDEIEEDIVFAFALKGKRVEEIHIFERAEPNVWGEVIAKHLLAYMEERGIPSHLYCDDERLRQMLHTLCKQIKLPLDYRSMSFPVQASLFRKAMELHNPAELFDEHFMDQAELHNKTVEETEKLFHKMMRYISYVAYRNDIEEE